MIKTVSKIRVTLSLSIVLAICISSIGAVGQDLVPISSITGGSSVFVFRNASKSSRKYSSSTRSNRSKSQRIETARKIKRQYDTLSKNAPRRSKSDVVAPDKLPPNIKMMPKDQASRLFAGVGEYYIERNDLENSVDFFRESLTLDPKNGKAQEGLSDALAAQGNELLLNAKAPTAKAFFLEALKYDPTNAAAYFGLGEVYSDAGQDDTAISSYEKALELDPELTEIYLPLGVLYFEKRELAKADDLLTKALSNSVESAEIQVFIGVIRTSQNKINEAMAAFNRAKALDPTLAEAYYHTGESYLRQNKNREAVPEFQKAISLKTRYFDAWSGLGAAQFELGNFTESINAYLEAAKIRNNDPETVLALAESYRMAGKYNEAQSNYDLATLFMSRDKDYSKDEIASVYSKIGYVIGQQCAINITLYIRCEWPTAIVALEKARELGVSNAADYSNLGWAYYNAARVDLYEKREAEGRAKLELAKQNIEKAIATDPSFVGGPLLNLGMTMTDLGDYEGAVEALTKVVNKEPKWAFALNELGIAYRKMNKYREASQNFKRAFDMDDKFAVAHYNWGEAEFRNGNLGNAKKAYQKLKKLGRNDLADQLDMATGGGASR